MAEEAVQKWGAPAPLVPPILPPLYIASFRIPDRAQPGFRPWVYAPRSPKKKFPYVVMATQCFA